jgi:hypothetical protein
MSLQQQEDPEVVQPVCAKMKKKCKKSKDCCNVASAVVACTKKKCTAHSLWKERLQTGQKMQQRPLQRKEVHLSAFN